MGELRASLYDIFGYLLPGLVGVSGIRLLLWGVYYPNEILTVAPFSSPIVVIVIGIVAYISGHIVHAIGNELPLTKSTRIDSNKTGTTKLDVFVGRRNISKEAQELLNETIPIVFDQRYAKLSDEEKFSLIDEARVFIHRENEREVYIYREGFYRGMVISCLVLFIGIIASLTVDNLLLTNGKEVFSSGRWERVALAIITVLSSLGFYRRMLRFSHYRLSKAVMLWLAFIKLK